MGADMNGHVGTDINGYEQVHGGHGYGMRNEEGERFLEMAQGLDLTIMNTYFKKPEEQKITYRSGTRSSQIDFLLVRNEDRKQIRDCKVIPAEAVVAQHGILVMDLIRNRNRKLLISRAPTKAKSQEPAYSQALNQNKIDRQGSRSRESGRQTVRRLWWMVLGVETGR